MCTLSQPCCEGGQLLLSADKSSRWSINEHSIRWTDRPVRLPDYRRRGRAHHAVAGVYDLNKEVVLEGRLKKLNFTNPHASIELDVPDKKIKGTIRGVEADHRFRSDAHPRGNQQVIDEAGEILKVTVLPAKNGNPAGFIRNLQLGDRSIRLFFGDGTRLTE
jgi:hypothetical protein